MVSVSADVTPADLSIEDARVLGREGRFDVAIADGVIRSVTPRDGGGAAGAGAAGAAPVVPAPAIERIDARGGLVSPSFVEPHYHPDKAFSRRGRVEQPDGFELAREIKAGFTEAGVEARATEAFRLAVSQGVGSMRANVDVDSIAGLTNVRGVLAARERVRDLIDVQVVAFPQEGLLRDAPAQELLVQAMAEGADVVGGWPNVEDGEAAQLAHLDFVFDLAERFDADLDVHVDCYCDPAERMLEPLAERTLARGFEGRVLASHCCGLEVYPDDDARRVIGRVAAAQIHVCVQPANTSAQYGPRGLSRTRELLAAGVPVSAGSDNMFDGWYLLGNLDPLDRAVLAYHGAGLGGRYTHLPTELLWELVTDRAAAAIGTTPGRVEAGAPADLVVFDAPDVELALAALPGKRTTIKRGRVVAARESAVWSVGGRCAACAP
ncbi:Cytosine deaminase [Conexibacter woesei DSM 14684]|uniref:Cytosine deaminase n=1 Tax=Conexibacter woesei (strain DSM 14684 / CCUG 47730 / CIP 108061 / JCM 11494 / NBRC 100937 / ID131577) TaxID=469383 RepID=D3F1S4_CONWI|nr:Cytosine deaminase [Conexibacter woesei DSM 14684]